VVKYAYDAWGVCDTIVLDENAANIANLNPFRYRSYYYDAETELYYLNTRYYDPQVGRFINADDVSFLGANGDFEAYNLYAYCSNNPVMYADPDGNLPKWLSGALNVVSGTLQMAGAFALGVTVGWTGVGAIAAGILAVNGAATITQGVGQIVNDIADEEVLREDNIIRAEVQSIGQDIAGDSGAEIAGYAYDAVVISSGIYASGVAFKEILDREMHNIVNSRLFSHNGGRGFKIGKTEFLYRNPNAKGGTGCTIFSHNGIFGKFRLDWDPTHHFHMHPPGHS
jgi:RHS repeat-associated protein